MLSWLTSVIIGVSFNDKNYVGFINLFFYLFLESQLFVLILKNLFGKGQKPQKKKNSNRHENVNPISHRFFFNLDGF